MPSAAGRAKFPGGVTAFLAADGGRLAYDHLC